MQFSTYPHFHKYLSCCFLLYLIAFTVLASGDFVIQNRLSNRVVFQSASDFVRLSECGSWFTKQPAYLQISSPLYTCEYPIPGPPGTSLLHQILKYLKSFLAFIASNLFDVNLLKVREEPSWVLVTGAEEDDKCSIHKKLINAAKAGYSAVLLASFDLPQASLNASVTLHQASSILDVHLINPFDIRVLSKYAFPSKEYSEFGIQTPARNDEDSCKEFYSLYSQTWIQNMFKYLANSKAITWTNKKLQAFYSYLNSYLYGFTKPKRSSRYDNIKSFQFTVAASVIILSPVIFLFLFQNGFIFRDRAQSNPRWSPGSGSRSNEPESYSDDDEETSEPPPPQPDPLELRRKEEEAFTLLGIPTTTKTETLTSALVNQAFRRKAITEHPDKFPESQRLQQNEKFKLVNEARSFLLTRCNDTPAS